MSEINLKNKTILITGAAGFIGSTRSSMPTLNEYIEEIRPIWDSHWLTNMGVKHRQLQAQLEEFLGIPHV